MMPKKNEPTVKGMRKRKGHANIIKYTDKDKKCRSNRIKSESW